MIFFLQKKKKKPQFMYKVLSHYTNDLKWAHLILAIRPKRGILQTASRPHTHKKKNNNNK